MPPIDPSYSRPSEILDREYGEGAKKLGGNPMSVIVAAGPYTVDSDLEYAPLGALLENAEDERPDVLVLVRESSLWRFDWQLTLPLLSLDLSSTLSTLSSRSGTSTSRPKSSSALRSQHVSPRSSSPLLEPTSSSFPTVAT